MSLTLVVNSTNITAASFNQVINVLQQPSGGQEIGRYYCGGNAYTTGCNLSAQVKTIQRYATPISVSLDQSDQGYSNCSGLSTNTLTQGGFHVFVTSTGAATQIGTAGKYTLQF